MELVCVCGGTTLPLAMYSKMETGYHLHISSNAERQGFPGAFNII